MSFLRNVKYYTPLITFNSICITTSTSFYFIPTLKYSMNCFIKFQHLILYIVVIVILSTSNSSQSELWRFSFCIELNFFYLPIIFVIEEDRIMFCIPTQCGIMSSTCYYLNNILLSINASSINYTCYIYVFCACLITLHIFIPLSFTTTSTFSRDYSRMCLLSITSVIFMYVMHVYDYIIHFYVTELHYYNIFIKL